MWQNRNSPTVTVELHCHGGWNSVTSRHVMEVMATEALMPTVEVVRMTCLLGARKIYLLACELPGLVKPLLASINRGDEWPDAMDSLEITIIGEGSTSPALNAYAICNIMTDAAAARGGMPGSHLWTVSVQELRMLRFDPAQGAMVLADVKHTTLDGIKEMKNKNARRTALHQWACQCASKGDAESLQTKTTTKHNNNTQNHKKKKQQNRAACG